MKTSPLFPRYQDYVIKDGKFVGRFEEMYRDHLDPWEQKKETHATDKVLAVALIQRIGAKTVLEIGCGFGHLTERIREAGITVVGVDIAPTAIAKARGLYPAASFEVGELMDLERYRRIRPDVIAMSEITWYVLDKLDAFLAFLRSELQNTALLHILTIYPPGVQKYGSDYFTNMAGIRRYFGERGMHFLEWGEHYASEGNGCGRSYFIGRWQESILC
jgi:SAM-dependent methyltransferase